MDSITPESVEILDQIDDGSTKSEIYEPEGGQRAQAEQSDLDEPDSGLHVMPQKRRKTMAAELSQSFMASMETMFQKSLGNIEVENTKLKEEIAKKNEEIVQLRNERVEMADKMKENEDLKKQMRDLTKFKKENEDLRKKNEKLKNENDRLISVNKEWKKQEEEWVRNKEGKKKAIEDLKKKNEDKKYQLEELKIKHEAEKKAIVALKKSKDENENGNLKKKYENAMNEISRLGRILNIYESQYVPSEISIRGRTIHWFTYTGSLTQVDFYLDGFNDEGYPIYAGIQKKMTKTGQKHKISNETDAKNFNTIYLTHDNKIDAGLNEVKRACMRSDEATRWIGMFLSDTTIKRTLGYWMISSDRNGGYAYAKVCANAVHPAQLGECWWEEWDCSTGNLLQENCSFQKCPRVWKATAKCYQIPKNLIPTDSAAGNK